MFTYDDSDFDISLSEYSQRDLYNTDNTEILHSWSFISGFMTWRSSKWNFLTVKNQKWTSPMWKFCILLTIHRLVLFSNPINSLASWLITAEYTTVYTYYKKKRLLFGVNPFSKKFWRTSVLFVGPLIPVLDFWWCLPWVSKPRLIERKQHIKS